MCVNPKSECFGYKIEYSSGCLFFSHYAEPDPEAEKVIYGVEMVRRATTIYVERYGRSGQHTK